MQQKSHQVFQTKKNLKVNQVPLSRDGGFHSNTLRETQTYPQISKSKLHKTFRRDSSNLCSADSQPIHPNCVKTNESKTYQTPNTHLLQKKTL